ncbi:UNVERIFIED_ORG: hypothetical protein [Escherichia phage CMSTMSU]
MAFTPDDPEHCLIVYRDSLPEAYAQSVADLVMNQGQSNVDLWEVMHKIGHLDGRKMLDVLHNLQHLRRARTCDIDMHVGGNSKISLDVLNNAINDNDAKNMKMVKLKNTTHSSHKKLILLLKKLPLLSNYLKMHNVMSSWLKSTLNVLTT